MCVVLSFVRRNMLNGTYPIISALHDAHLAKRTQAETRFFGSIFLDFWRVTVYTYSNLSLVFNQADSLQRRRIHGLHIPGSIEGMEKKAGWPSLSRSRTRYRITGKRSFLTPLIRG